MVRLALPAAGLAGSKSSCAVNFLNVPSTGTFICFEVAVTVLFAVSTVASAKAGATASRRTALAQVRVTRNQVSAPAAAPFLLVTQIRHHGPGTEHQQTAQIRVSRFRDAAKPLLAAATVLPRRQSEP